jgi:DNA-binding transcriptional regulator YhcF (GntR family)
MPGIAEHERQQEVLRLLEGTGKVSVPELAQRLGVSVVTVRKDLDALERRRILRRVRGGAVAVRGADEGAFEMRVRYRVPEKQAIARAAAELVRDGDAIGLDCSTTCYHLAREIRDRSGLIVVTNGLRAAEVLSESDATVVMPGGTLRRSSWSLVGDLGTPSTAVAAWPGASSGCAPSRPSWACWSCRRRRPRPSARWCRCATRCTGSSTPARSADSHCTPSSGPGRSTD